MESMFYIKLLIICTAICRISSDNILVTKDQCGRSIELVRQKIVTLEHAGENVGDTLSPCVIDFVNNVNDDAICIRTDSSNWFNMHCLLLLKYYPQGYPSSYYAKGYSCGDFSSRPVCARSRRSSVVYLSSFYTRNETVTVWLYTEKYTPTTTSSPWSYWSSWSSWSSNSDSYDDHDDDDGNNTGVVIGLTVGISAVVFVLMMCIKACQKKPEAPKPIYGPPVQLTPQNNQPQYPGTQPNTLVAQNQYMPDPTQFPGYQVHAPVYQSVPNESMSAGYQSNQNYPEPSATGCQQQRLSTPYETVAEPSAPTLEPTGLPPSYESLNISQNQP